MKMLRLLLLKGMPWKLIGDPVSMLDGTIAVAVMMDLREFELIHEARNSTLLRWFTQDESTSDQAQLPAPELCLQHSISA